MLDPKKEPKKPWPTKDAMAQIYAKNLWGGSDYDFYSGDGSHNPEISLPYIDAVASFLASFENPLVVCDLGCGDFHIGKELVRHTKKYLAVDIVPDLIARNKEKFQAKNLEFHCLDLAVDDMPDGECALLRQVLQHLSNVEVQSIVNKLDEYKYVILTEHIPEGDFIPNVDIISGQGIRLKKNSGIDLSAPPFCFRVKEVRTLSFVQLLKGRGVISTKLYVV